MIIETIKTNIIEPNQNIIDIITTYCNKSIEEKSILVITSKIISVCQNNMMSKASISKKELIKQEAEYIFNQQDDTNSIILTIKYGHLIPCAGIDESNGNNNYILYPNNLQKITNTIWSKLRKIYNIKDLGIIISDSTTRPLRRGVTGIGLSWCGFYPIKDYRGTKDLYHQPLAVTTTNYVDALAAAAVMCMGEGNEQTPMACIKKSPVLFCQNTPNDHDLELVKIPYQEDIYKPLFPSNIM